MGTASTPVEPRRAESLDRQRTVSHSCARVWTYLLPALRRLAHGGAIRGGSLCARSLLAVAHQLCLVRIPGNLEPARFLLLAVPAGGRQRDGADGGSLRRQQAGPGR